MSSNNKNQDGKVQDMPSDGIIVNDGTANTNQAEDFAAYDKRMKKQSYKDVKEKYNIDESFPLFRFTALMERAKKEKVIWRPDPEVEVSNVQELNSALTEHVMTHYWYSLHK